MYHFKVCTLVAFNVSQGHATISNTEIQNIFTILKRHPCLLIVTSRSPTPSSHWQPLIYILCLDLTILDI